MTFAQRPWRSTARCSPCVQLLLECCLLDHESCDSLRHPSHCNCAIHAVLHIRTAGHHHELTKRVVRPGRMIVSHPSPLSHAASDLSALVAVTTRANRANSSLSFLRWTGRLAGCRSASKIHPVLQATFTPSLRRRLAADQSGRGM